MMNGLPADARWDLLDGTKQRAAEDDGNSVVSKSAHEESSVTAAVHFPGFEETAFSTPERRYFYKQTGDNYCGCGDHAVVEEVYWYNPGTGELELRVAKSLRLDMAATHRNGVLGWKAAAAREVAALKRLAGVPGVVRYRDVAKDKNGGIHIVMEKADGFGLPTRMNFRHCPKVGLTWVQLELALKQLAQVLFECHKRGVVHGDLKPDNIVSLKDKSGIVLLDFGSATLLDGRSSGYEGGRILYTAPEMLRFARSKRDDGPQGMLVFGPAVDCWAYGLTTFKLLTGRTLFIAPEDAPLDDTGSEMDDDAWTAWQARYIADLHADWEDPSGSRPVQITFREEMQQLADVSEQFHEKAVDFIGALLHPDPAHRMTAEKALGHPFLTTAFFKIAADSLPSEVKAEVVFDMGFDDPMVVDIVDAVM